MMTLIANLIYMYFVYSMALFWTSVMIVKTAITFVRNPSKFLYKKPRLEPPAVLREEFEHGYLITDDRSIRIHYVEAGDKKRPLLLCLHGFPEFWYSWRHQLREFKRDFHVVAIDMRGYGDSSKPKSIGAYKIDALIEDIRAVVTQLAPPSSSTNPKCYLAAHDWGGAVAWRFTLRYPEMVEKLIICNCPHPRAFPRKFSLRDLPWSQFLKSWYMFFFQSPYLPELVMQANDCNMLIGMLTRAPVGCTDPQAFTVEDIEAWKYTFQQAGALTPPINYYRANMGRPPPREPRDQPGSAPRGIVQPPTLIIWGTSDAALDTQLAHYSLEYCRDGTLRLIEGASHWVQQDRPEMCNQYIREFLKAY